MTIGKTVDDIKPPRPLKDDPLKADNKFVKIPWAAPKGRPEKFVREDLKGGRHEPNDH